MDQRKQVGRLGEEIATSYLLEKGYEILDRNWFTRLGELDIIAREAKHLVFIEVRTTRGSRFGYGFQSVNFRKQQKIKRLATQYIQQKQLWHLPIRFDVISVLLDSSDTVKQLDYIHNAF